MKECFENNERRCLEMMERMETMEREINVLRSEPGQVKELTEKSNSTNDVIGDGNSLDKGHKKMTEEILSKKIAEFRNFFDESKKSIGYVLTR
jgi:hypothetical protein